MIDRIPELPYNGLLPNNAKFPWYNPADDITYHANGNDFLFGLSDPNDAWNPAYSYSLGEIATDGGKIWISLSNGNLGNPPGPASLFWDEEPDPDPGLDGPYWPLEGDELITDSVYMASDDVFGIKLGGNSIGDPNKMLGFFAVDAAGSIDLLATDGVQTSVMVMESFKFHVEAIDGFAQIFAGDNGGFETVSMSSGDGVDDGDFDITSVRARIRHTQVIEFDSPEIDYSGLAAPAVVGADVPTHTVIKSIAGVPYKFFVTPV
jgi:hypothetical protein